MSDISVLGCGWLGFPFAKACIQKGLSVKGSSRTSSKLNTLKKAGITPFFLSISQSGMIKGDDDFFTSPVCVITLPFKRSFKDPSVYISQVKAIIKRLEENNVETVVFTSSTSIYPPNQQISHEGLFIQPYSERSTTLLETENLILNFSGQSIICRLGGLYGPERSSARIFEKGFLTGSKNPVNLIHQEDAISLLSTIIIKRYKLGFSEVFNGVAPIHPSKSCFYKSQAKKKGIKYQLIEDGLYNKAKQVCSIKTRDKLSYAYMYPNPALF